MEEKLKKSWIKIIGFIILFILLMQIVNIIVINNLTESKVLIDGFLSLTYYENTGGAFGVGQGDTIGFAIISIIVIAIIIRFMILQRDRIDTKTMIALELIIAGGVSNLIDRLFRGYVVDMFHFIFWGREFAVFNVADILVCVGTFFIAIAIIFSEDSKKEKIDKEKGE